jgi:uncharacterized protein YqhQ
VTPLQQVLYVLAAQVTKKAAIQICPAVLVVVPSHLTQDSSPFQAAAKILIPLSAAVENILHVMLLVVQVWVPSLMVYIKNNKIFLGIAENR